MASGWIDVHGHFLPSYTAAQRRQMADNYKKAKFVVSDIAEWSPEATLAYLDKAGVQMQMLSFIPGEYSALQKSNDRGAEVVRQYPTRFGLFAAIPTDNIEDALQEADRADLELQCDGFAVACCYKGIYLSDKKLDPLWAQLNAQKATVFCHPGTTAEAPLAQALPLIEVAFETTRTIVDMIFQAVLRRYPDINWIVAHCGGCLPALAGRLKLLALESWNSNPHGITRDELISQLSSLYLDTAATMPEGLDPALRMVASDHIVYGADCGVPCSTEETMEKNRSLLLGYDRLTFEEKDAVGSNALKILPRAAKRLQALGHP